MWLSRYITALTLIFSISGTGCISIKFKHNKFNNMYRFKKAMSETTTLKRNTSFIGEPVETKVARILNNKEPIKDGAPLIYAERKDGVKPEYNIRSDRFEMALDAMDNVSKSHIAKRSENAEIGKQAKEGMAKEGETPVNTSDN